MAFRKGQLLLIQFKSPTVDTNRYPNNFSALVNQLTQLSVVDYSNGQRSKLQPACSAVGRNCHGHKLIHIFIHCR